MNARKPKLPPPPTEHQEQAALFEWAETMAAFVPDLHMLAAVLNTAGLQRGNQNSHAMVRKLCKIGLKAGYPDVTLDVASGGYHGLRIEMKRLRGSDLKDEHQLKYAERLRAQGYRAVMSLGWVNAACVVIAYLSPRLTSLQRARLWSSLGATGMDAAELHAKTVNAWMDIIS